MAALLADNGHTVVGLDVNAAFVEAVRSGRGPTYEPGLDDLMLKNQSRLSATGDYQEAVLATEITFIVVPTPSKADGTFSLDFVLAACEGIGAALREKRGFHLVTVTSTVMPGATGGPVKAVLEESSGKTCIRDFGLCYNPQFIALGSVIRDMSDPDFVLIGESDSRSGALLAGLYEHSWPNPPPIRRMNFVNAELTKLAVNTFVTTKITYANMLARLCERLPGADVDVITDALGLDSRIGPKYLKGALGYGGPCFPRDNIALSSVARGCGTQAVLAEATDRFNREQVLSLADAVLERLPEGGRIGILGLSYKPNTNVIEESQGMAFAQYFLAKGVPVVVYDPAALPTALPHLEGSVTVAESAAACARQADLLMITTPWDEFRNLSADCLNVSKGWPVIVDCWRILRPEGFAGRAEFVALGRGPEQPA